MESTDCGAVCLQMLCAFYGKPVSLQNIKEGLSISRIGITIRDVKNRATELGLNTIVAKATLQQLLRCSLQLFYIGIAIILLFYIKLKKNEIIPIRIILLILLMEK